MAKDLFLNIMKNINFMMKTIFEQDIVVWNVDFCYIISTASKTNTDSLICENE